MSQLFSRDAASDPLLAKKNKLGPEIFLQFVLFVVTLHPEKVYCALFRTDKNTIKQYINN
jgi:hypothetical protein